MTTITIDQPTLPGVPAQSIVTKLERPHRCEQPIIRAAAEALAPRIADWAEETVSAQLLADYANDLEEAMHSRPSFDGYALATYLDDQQGWSVDAELVELLNSAEAAVTDAHRDAVRLWIKFYQIKPAFTLGTLVLFENYDFAQRQHRLYQGEIYRIDEELGQYYIRCTDLGHVPEGQIGTQGTILDYEKVRAVATQEKA